MCVYIVAAFSAATNITSSYAAADLDYSRLSTEAVLVVTVKSTLKYKLSAQFD